MRLLGVVASSYLQSTTAFNSIATTTVGSGGASSVTFNLTGVTGYKHLQIRAINKNNKTDNLANNYGIVYFNGDNSSNLYIGAHYLYGDGTSASAGASIGSGNNNFIYGIGAASNYTGGANIFSASIIDILDYTNTSKYKTLRVLMGADFNNSSGSILFGSGAWMNTNAITSITISYNPGFYLPANSIMQYSSFALYGIK